MKQPSYSAEQLAQSAADAWNTALAEAIAGNTDKVPVGFMRLAELQKIFGLGSRQTQESIKVMTNSGKAERKIFRIKTLSGVKPIPHYRLK